VPNPLLKKTEREERRLTWRGSGWRRRGGRRSGAAHEGGPSSLFPVETGLLAER